MAVGDIWRLKIACWMRGQLGLNVRYYVVAEESGGPVSALAVANRVDTGVRALYQAVLCADAVFMGVSAARVIPAPPELASVSEEGEDDGMMNDVPLPSQCAGIITLRTGSSGREWRGRAFIPFPGSDAANTDGMLADNYFGDLEALGAALIQTLDVEDGPNLAALAPIITAPPFGAYRQIADYAVRREFGTQRRRGALGANNPRAIPL